MDVMIIRLVGGGRGDLNNLITPKLRQQNFFFFFVWVSYFVRFEVLNGGDNEHNLLEYDDVTSISKLATFRENILPQSTNCD
jgi:hypothetical protein